MYLKSLLTASPSYCRKLHSCDPKPFNILASGVYNIIAHKAKCTRDKWTATYAPACLNTSDTSNWITTDKE
jgi:hypothetical protein